jgi:hypothetical protein
MVVVAVGLSRLLRRGLFVAVLAAAGWLLGAAFAGTASADELPGDNPQAQSSNLLGSLLNGLTGSLGGVTTTIVDTAGDILSPAATQAPAPIVDLPSLLPAIGSASGGVTTDRDDVSRAETVAPVPVVTPPAPAVPPAAPVVAPPTPAPPVAPPVVVPVVPAAPAAAPDSGTTDHAGQGGSEPQPVKTPAAPASSGATVSTAHDNAGGARGTYGVLPSQATFHPADAGFTTRSRAVNAAGRAAGLPASSPD